MASILPPPPTDNNPASPSFRDWYYKLQQVLQNFVLIVINGLDGLGNGFVVKTSSTTYAAREITAGTGISVTNGEGVSANPEISNTGALTGFTTIAVSGQSDVVADSASDTLTLIAGTDITITTDASTDSITINSSGSSAGYPQHTLQSDITVESYESYIVVGPFDLNGFTLTLDGRLAIL